GGIGHLVWVWSVVFHSIRSTNQPMGSRGCFCKRPAAMGNLLLLLPHPAKAKLRPPTAAAKRGTLFFCSFSTDGPSSTMTVSITGATGFVGRRLVQ
uniref:NAD-dependent epimerase/dehydratase domain-containing protein n=1 Tax=Oryza glaberrima TaxID=4538 RepID=I1P5X7_ORYGL